MPLISVKAKPGSVVRETVYGKVIPTDRYVNVEHTPRIRRFIEVWGDLEVEPKPVAKPAPVAVKPVEPVADKPKPAA